MTASAATASFSKQFEALTGFAPMKWQCRLFNRFIDAGLPHAQGIPAACDIPTGLGKTSVMVIWLLALAHQADGRRVRLPRRLVYIVNRRTVVDQATCTVERIRCRLLEPESQEWEEHADTLKGVASALRRLSAFEGSPLGVSTLRGEFADNEEWKADPARPAIVVGTIDMIGSKLLFSGYGDGRYGRAHHAGLVGYDALIVHDEAHLTPAFNDVLQAVAQEQAREASRGGRPAAAVGPVRVVELSATGRGAEESAPFTLEPDDEDDPVVHERMTATKRLYLHEAPRDRIAEEVKELNLARGKAKVELERRISQWRTAEIVRRAADHDGSRCRVLIYVRTPAQAQQTAAALVKALGADGDERVARLTGTIRGYERDALVQTNLVYRSLLHPELRVEKSVYLVSTSAGEVGIDLDADHLVCDLTTLDALIQRLGRVNRRGGDGRTARVDVVADVEEKDEPSEYDRAIAATHSLLGEWAANAAGDYINVGPQDLRQLTANECPERIQAAFSPRARPPRLDDVVLDNWSLTSIDTMPGRQEIAPFLHGLTTFDRPETYVAWRKEIPLLHEAGVDDASLRDWFRACRIEARERLHDRNDRVRKTLEELLSNLRKKDSSLDFPIVLLDERGGALWSLLSAAASDTNLDYRTVVLPVAAGGLDRNGLLNPKAEPPALDVADIEAEDRRRERWLHRRSVDGEQFTRLVFDDLVADLPFALREKQRIPLCEPDEGNDEADSVDLVLLVSPAASALENPETASVQQTLATHTAAILRHMSRIATELDIVEPARSALIAAARWHDMGKNRRVWQRYARNEANAEPLAKARRYLHPRALGGYRHEFGSLLDAMNDADIRKHGEEYDLILHLIAAHHGWARPHFEPRSLDVMYTTDVNQRALSEVVRRFGQLQQTYGRWGLAWLESLLRCADIAASREVVESDTSPNSVVRSREGDSQEGSL